MAIIDKQVNDADDDAYSSQDYGMFCDGEVIVRLGYSFVCGKCRGIFRFPGISGLGGATITVAYVEFYIISYDGITKLRIHAEDIANPDQILYLNDHINAVRTTNYTDWTHDGFMGWRQSPSLVSVIQELADSYDPSAIQLLVDFQPDITEGNSFDVRAYEYPSLVHGAKLHIEYEGTSTYYHGLSIQGEGELALCDVGSHPLRIRKGETTYGIELVATDDPNASKVRVKTGTGIKAIRKYT